MENYFFETDETSHNKDFKYYILVIYDMVDNKRRAKLVKIMKSFGFRVQKSAFEARLTESKYSKMLSKLPQMVEDDDSIRVYKIRGKGAVTVFGKDDTIDEQEVIVI
jgi:CRISPR-associated protein Cas2